MHDSPIDSSRDQGYDSFDNDDVTPVTPTTPLEEDDVNNAEDDDDEDEEETFEIQVECYNYEKKCVAFPLTSKKVRFSTFWTRLA